MKYKDKIKVEELHLDIPFYEWIDGELELAEEIYNNYLSNASNIEKIKKFIILDYLTSLENDDFAKLCKNFKSKKTIDDELQLKNDDKEIEIEDFPF